RSAPDIAVHAAETSAIGTDTRRLGAAHLVATSHVSAIARVDRRARLGATAAALDHGCVAVAGARPGDPVRHAHRNTLMGTPVAIEIGAAVEERPARIIGRPVTAD